MAAVVAVVAACPAAAAVAAPVSWPHGTLDNRFTTKKPGAPTGFSFTGEYHAANDPSGDPPYMRRMTFYLPRGMYYDTSVPELCTASDLELEARGAAACPPGSRLGGGHVESKFMGFPSPPLEIDVLNNTGEMIMLARSPIVSTVTRGKVGGDGTVEFEAPTCFPHHDPPGCPIDTVLQLGSSIKVPPYLRSSDGVVRSYATTPPKCPTSRRWRTPVRFWWADGSEETVVTKQPCKRGKHGKRAKRRSARGR